jgi:integral membrane protein
MQTLGRYITYLYDKMHLFTDQEAWGMYRFAAFVEAGIWGFFIFTIGYQLLGLPQAESVFAFGRSVLGVAYVVYAILTLLGVRSMEWGIGRVALALVAGALPFGSLVFEHFMGKYRKAHPAFIAAPKGYDE